MIYDFVKFIFATLWLLDLQGDIFLVSRASAFI